ncbi:MAG: hypothetical protein AAGI91_16435 [Bacteroidota bacterium]
MALVVGGMVLTVRLAGAGEAQRLLGADLPTARLLCSTVMTVGATTLALLSLSTGDDHSLGSLS